MDKSERSLELEKTCVDFVIELLGLRGAEGSVPLPLLLRLFKSGQPAAFFKAWQNLGEPEEPEVRQEWSSLSLLLRVYFATREPGPHATDLLREFLEEKGAEYSARPELLHFFALPYVSDPRNHPTFAHVFRESWVRELETRLVDLVTERSWKRRIAAGPEPPPRYDEYNELKRNFRRLKRDHHNAVRVAGELASALESSVRGRPVDLRSTLANCAAIFPELFSKPQEEAGPEPDWRVETDYALGGARSYAAEKEAEAGAGPPSRFLPLSPPYSSGTLLRSD